LLSVNLATLAIASLFYGIYFVLFFVSMYLLMRRSKRKRAYHSPSRKEAPAFRSMVFLSAVFLFLVVTSHWITIVYRAFIAYASLQHGEEAEAFFNDHSQSTEMIQDIFLALSILIGDSLIIHRLWVVWSHSKLVLVLPICNLITLTVCSVVSTKVVWSSTDIFSNPWLKLNTILTLMCGETHLSNPHRQHFLVIIVESAGFYAFWAVLFAVTYEAKSNIQASVIQIAPAVVGLVNALIHTRVGLGWSS
ncbi:hypothetical protein B0H17DRAFT_835820, partial [Mycena rosella]